MKKYISYFTFHNPNSQKGQSIVEILIVMGIASIILPAVVGGIIASREGKAQEKQRIQAIGLLQEAQEAIRNVREHGWDNIATNGTFHPEISGGTYWILAGNQETIGLFTRKIDISNVFRDTNGTIVASGGILDPSTKKIYISVSWQLPYSSSISASSYLTRYLDNATYTETTETQFNTGTKTGVTVTNTSGGEVILGSGGKGSWCSPSLSITALDLPKQGVANALTAIEGRAFAGTGENASGESFANIAITNTNPPSASILGVMDGYKTNGIFGEANYGYIATDTNSKEISVIDITTTPYSEIGYFNSPGPDDATSVFVAGNTGYMTANNSLYTFDLTSKTGSRPQLGTISLGAPATKVYVVGNFAYVTASSGNQFRIINISNPSSPNSVGSISLPAQGAIDVFVNISGTRAYVATAVSASERELFIIDITNKSVPTLLGSYDTNSMNPKGVTVVTGNVAIIVGSDGEEYQVVNITNESAPAHCGGLEVAAGVRGVSSVLESDGDAFSYIITGDANSEFKIIEGGPGGQFASEGTFESQTFDPGYSTAFNRLSANVNIPSSTDIKLQVSVEPSIAGSCNGVTFNFAGPDGTSNTFFTATGSIIEGAIPLSSDGIGYENPGRCFRYKAFLSTTDPTRSPTLYDVTVNYSP